MSGKRNSSAPSDPSNSIGSSDLELAGAEILESYKAVEEVWKRAEAKLLLSHVPQDVKVNVGVEYLGHYDSPHGERLKYLGFIKLKSAWRICFIEEDRHYDDPDDGWTNNCTPITEAPVEVRVEMMDWFGPLAKEVVKTIRTLAPKYKKKAAELEAVIELMDL